MTGTAVHISRVHAVAVPVSDQERALTFYGEVLGMELRRDAIFGVGQRWIEVAPPGAETTVALPPPHPGVQCGVDTGLRLTTPNAESAHAALRVAGVDVDELLSLPGAPPMFFLRDPDANTLVVVESD